MCLAPVHDIIFSRTNDIYIFFSFTYYFRYHLLADIARMLQELSDEGVDNCRELESDSDLNDENIDYDDFDCDWEQNISDKVEKYVYSFSSTKS